MSSPSAVVASRRESAPVNGNAGSAAGSADGTRAPLSLSPDCPPELSPELSPAAGAGGGPATPPEGVGPPTVPGGAPPPATKLAPGPLGRGTPSLPAPPFARRQIRMSGG